jgi:hypothetical protein
MVPRGQDYLEPPRWDDERLEADRRKAIVDFREERIREPLEEYLEKFEEARDAFDELMEETVDLTGLSARAVDILTNPELLSAVRYLAGPPISHDDLRLLADATFASSRLRADPAMAQRIIETVMLGLDRQRFPWLTPNEIREATETERASAVLASAALMATQRVATNRRNESKSAQEERVRQELMSNGFAEVARRTANRLEDAPKAGEFCMESQLGSRKADLIVGIWDGRTMPVECKVSNSFTNSIKRLNNDAAVKATRWHKELGSFNVVPVAVLSGAFKLRNLIDAQRAGLTLFWAHDLASFTVWLAQVKAG